MKTITEEQLREIKETISYNPKTGIFRWKKSTSGRRMSDSPGGLDVKGYLRIRIKGARYFAHQLAWIISYEVSPPPMLDHIDRNPLNNRIKNLRPATYSLNTFNRGPSKSNKTGVVGVHQEKGNSPWVASIRIPSKTGIGTGKKISLGRFKTKKQAILARKKAEKKYYPPLGKSLDK